MRVADRARLLVYGCLAVVGGIVLAAFLALGLGGSPAGAATAGRHHPQTSSAGTDAGYSIVGADGGVYAFGNATFAGSHVTGLNAPAVGVATDPATQGYWMAAADGGIFAFNAPFYGSMGGQPLAAPIVGIATTRTGGGYWLVGADGGVFAFGNAPFYGSMGGQPLNKPIVGIAAAPGGGYWLVGADGGIFAFNAPFYGSMGGQPLAAPIVGIASAPAGGYWLVGADGGIFAFDLPFFGSSLGSGQQVVALASTSDGGGYWEVTNTGVVFVHGDAQTAGSVPSAGVSVTDVVGIAGLTLPPSPPTPPSPPYVAPPAITSLSPSKGVTAGGTSVTIAGTSFTTVTKVTFGGASVPFSTTATTLTVTSSPHAAGPVNVNVTTAFGTSALATYTYVAPPAITSITSDKGPVTGGTVVVIEGSSIETVTGVTFGGTHARFHTTHAHHPTEVAVLSVPAHAAGAVTVTVTTTFGISAPATYAYVAPPTITTVSPTYGSPSGGNTVTITGTNLAYVTSVHFGTTPPTSVAPRTDTGTTITVVAPAHAAGTVTLYVESPGGYSLGERYTFVAPPKIAYLSPVNGPVAGGTTVYIVGTNFLTVTAVTFGGTSVSYALTATMLTVTAPAHDAGAGHVTVTVTTAFGKSAPAVYTYLERPTVTSITPTHGPMAGGNTLTITGTNFTTVGIVYFGAKAVSPSSVTSTTITVTVPPEVTVGTVTAVISVNNAAGTSTNGQIYRYTGT